MATSSDDEHRVDRLWPDPVADLPLADVVAGYEPPRRRSGRPGVAINMVTSVDGRAQLDGTADGLGSRGDRLLMRHYRAAFDAVGSGAGTLRATGVWLRVGDALAARRASEGRLPNPLGVVIAGGDAVPTDGSWFEGDDARILVVGRDNPMTDAFGTDILRAPTAEPDPRWVLERLVERGVGAFLLEGGPRINAAFLAAGVIDEVLWTVGSLVTGADALPMIAPPPTGVMPDPPRRLRLQSAFRHADELFLRYRFDEGG